MKKRIVLTIIVLSIVIMCILLLRNKKEDKTIAEYTPEQEISEKQERKSRVTLYFEDIETGEIMPEIREVDSKELLENPYVYILKLLIAGPENINLKSNIPIETKVNKVELTQNIAIIDFSEDFVTGVSSGKETEEKNVLSIAKTLKELNEINQIRIIINGEENLSFEDKELNFNQLF